VRGLVCGKGVKIGESSGKDSESEFGATFRSKDDKLVCGIIHNTCVKTLL